MADVLQCRPVIGCRENPPSLLVTDNFRYDFTGSRATSSMYFRVKIVALGFLKGFLKLVSNFKHCNGNSAYIFLFWELRGLSPNFHIHVSVSDLYIPRIGPYISSSRKGRPIVDT
jgi:hypothetical protein